MYIAYLHLMYLYNYKVSSLPQKKFKTSLLHKLVTWYMCGVCGHYYDYVQGSIALYCLNQFTRDLSCISTLRVVYECQM